MSNRALAAARRIDDEGCRAGALAALAPRLAALVGVDVAMALTPESGLSGLGPAPGGDWSGG